MSEISKYEDQVKKMQSLCDEHHLCYSFKKTQYPIVFTLLSCQDMEGQLSMLEDAETDGYRSPDARMSWTFADGELSTKVSGGTFTISKTLRSKIENILLKMIGFWQQYFFRDVIEKDSLRRGMMPVIKEDEADDSAEDDELPEDGEPDDELVEPEDLDQIVKDAIALVRAENKATTSLLQRRLNIGYAEASTLLDTLEALGVIGPYRGGEPREVLPTDLPEDEDED